MAVHHLTVELTAIARPDQPAREPVFGAVAAGADRQPLSCSTRTRTVHVARWDAGGGLRHTRHENIPTHHHLAPA